MHIRITGTSGQIGINLALRLLDAGHQVFGEATRDIAEISSAATLLGNQPRMLLNESIRHAVAWSCTWAEQHPPAEQRGERI